jgi:hypothetical protein|nr:MAG TPA: hypothetical protein [Caudoviricetes sp.]
MNEEMLDKLEEIKELVITTICDSQSICSPSCEDCELHKDINNIIDEFHDFKLLIEKMDM